MTATKAFNRRAAPRVVQMAGQGFPTKRVVRERNLLVYVYGNEFLGVALKAGSPLVRAYLLGHALELYLKAYLHSHGFGAAELKDEYGHNLERLLGEAEARGLGKLAQVSSAARADIAALNRVYESKALEYFSIFQYLVPTTVPRLDRITRLARALQSALRQHLQVGT